MLNAIDQLFAEIRTTPIGELYEKLSTKPTPDTTEDRLNAKLKGLSDAFANMTKTPASSKTGLDALSAELVRKNVSYKEMGDELVKAALKTANGNKSAAARLVSMDRKAFERRLRRVKK